MEENSDTESLHTCEIQGEYSDPMVSDLEREEEDNDFNPSYFGEEEENRKRVVEKYWGHLLEGDNGNRSWIYTIYNIEKKKHEFYFFNEYEQFYSFLILNWFWSKACEIYMIKKVEKVYVSYTMDKNKDIHALKVRYTKGRRVKKEDDENIVVLTPCNGNSKIYDNVRSAYTKNKYGTELRDALKK